MKNLLVTCAVLTLSACATVPDSVKIALEKEGAAISAVESDYKASVGLYHAELINQIDARLDDIFKYEVEKRSAGKTLTAAEVMTLDNARAEQRRMLVAQAESVKQRYLNSRNLEILKALHARIAQYAASDAFTAGDFSALLTELDSGIEKIKSEEKK